MEDYKGVDDKELVKRVFEKKDSFWFGILYDRYANMVYGKCLSFVKNSQEAKDLTHDIFVKAYLKLNTYKGESKFSTWIYALTCNYCIDYVRKKRINLVETEFRDIEINEEDEVSDASLFNVKAEKLAAVLELIHPEEKMILLMKYQDDQSIKAIAKVLSIGESAVKMRLSRAKIKIVELYKQNPI